MDDPSLDSRPVYHGAPAPEETAAPPTEVPRAFYIDVYTDDDSDDTEHAYYGATNPAGGAVARGIDEHGFYSLSDPERFAARVGGHVVWI
ncbi:hypothetical protein [Nocardiopsis ansamitocini]|uniref:Uncharacterized protein n=1 Tax=Nocardiopsis ansamitocini TaxID=1670832 RepID=A0A9W6P973_9ACTN|nr:hypothetical protein [Nocardiopsis ansamitocini]GLU49436.1 hypothetical protein Nans01_37870 [Nocardiopsis ansamitocini]